jgi:hypothetical protein
VRQRIEPGRHAGILDGKARVSPEKGSPHGSVSSPLVANVYVPEVLDTWCETVVQAHGRGHVVLDRDADEVLIGCEVAEDARRRKDVLPQRVAQ